MQGTNGTLLLVEDDADLAAALLVRFRNNFYELLHAPTGGAALRLVNSHEPDLLILDLMLPDMPGEEVLQRIRQQSNVPVVIISAKSEELDRINGLEAGADDYVTKPLSPRELVSRVNAVLRRSRITGTNGNGRRRAPRASHSVLRLGDIMLELDKREASIGGQPLELSPTEFRLLRVLVERGGSAISVDQILQSVWAYDGYDRHIVESCIHRLRSKIEDDPCSPKRLLTIRGFGYKLRAVGEE